MHIGHHLPGGLVHEHRLAVSHLNDKILFRLVRYHGVGDQGSAGTRIASHFLISTQHGDLTAVNLLDINQLPLTHYPGDNFTVSGN